MVWSLVATAMMTPLKAISTIGDLGDKKGLASMGF
jgi:hypothetical protein